MTDRISLTAAEIAFLLSVGGAADSPAPRLLNLTAADRSEAVIAAGLGSLLLRHLVAPAAGQQQVELAPALVAVAEGLARPRVCVQVGLAANNQADGALLFESGQVRFLLSPRAYRCYDVAGVDPRVDRRDPLVLLAQEFMETNGPGVASFNVWSDDPQRTWASVRLREDARWTFVTGRHPDVSVPGLSEDAALTRLHEELGYLLPEYAAAP